MTAGRARAGRIAAPILVLALLIAVVFGTVRISARGGGVHGDTVQLGSSSPSTRPTGSTGSTGPTAPATNTPATSVSPVPSSTPAGTPPGTATGSTPAELPRGGQTLFPRYRLVGYSGGPGTAAFGRLGVGDIDDRVAEIERTGRSFTAGGREVMPVLELITVVVHSTPGPDKKYRGRIGDDVIEQYLAAARRHKALLLLNIQPGRADFLPEVQALSKWLAEPDVGIALDPEWAVGPGQVPGRVFGRTDAKELNQVGAWLGSFTRQHRLPEKAMVVHQLATRIIGHVEDVKAHKGVQVILSVDGIGARTDKEATWRRLVKPMPDAMAPGFKLFFEEDRELGKLMTPRQVLELRPRPDYVLYE